MGSLMISDLRVHGAQSEHLYDDEHLTVTAELTNTGTIPVQGVEVTLVLGSEEVHERVDVPAQASARVSGTLGPLHAGGYELEATGSYEDEASASSQVIDPVGASVLVDARPPAAPSARIESLHLQPHTNVEHAANTAWSTEAVRVSVRAHNTGTTHLDAALVVAAGDQRFDAAVALAPGAEQWYTFDTRAFAPGTVEVGAWLTTETATQSVALDHASVQLTVVAAPTDDGTGSSDWVVANAQFRVTDFRGQPMRSHHLLVRFVGMDGSLAFGGETIEAAALQGGLQTCSRVHIPREGTVQLYGVSSGAAGAMLEGQCGYRLVGTDHNLSFDVVQQHEDLTFSARSAEEVSRMVGSEVSAGLTIDILEIGGKVATEDTRSRTYEQAVEWKVRVARSELTVTTSDPAGGH